MAALDYEIAQEQASALGRIGRALESALTALAEHDSSQTIESCPPSAPAPQLAASATRARLVSDASEMLWCFLVQREACGLRDPRPVLREYRVPAEVYARMGIFERR
ncbi:MAG: DUF6665 family protein [Xanthobacteraceae bacterium]